MADHGDQREAVCPIFRTGFLRFLESREFSDAVIVCDNVEYPVHRMIVSYSSEFFARSFLSSFRESREQRIVLNFPDREGVFPLLIDYMYRGEVDLNTEIVIPLLAMADTYLVKSLKTLCHNYIASCVTRQNSVSMLSKAVDSQMFDIISQILPVVVKNFHFLAEENLSFLPAESYLELITNPSLAVKSEVAVLQNVLTYVTHAGQGCTPEQIKQMFESVRYPWMTFPQLEEAQKNPLIPKQLLVQGLMVRLRRFEGPRAAGGMPNPGPLSPKVEDPATQLRFAQRPPYSITFPHEEGWNKAGIIYYVGTKGYTQEFVNPATSGDVAVTTSSIEVGSPVNILAREPAECWTKDVPASWFQIDLGEDRSVIPSHYTLRHGGNYKADSLRTWDLQGSMDGQLWTLLSRHHQDKSLNDKFAVASWPVENCTNALRFFRILQTGHSSSKHNFLVLSGFEVYGDFYQRVTPE